jgi:hypothetical protein
VHDGTTHSSSAHRFLAGLLTMLSPKVLIDSFGTLVVACGAFLVSRRWLIGSLLITGLLLALVVVARPSAHFGFNTPEDAGTMFDEVQRFPLGSKTAESQFRPGAPELGRFADDANKLNEAPLQLAPNETVSQEPAQPQERREMSRRLDAVRSRQARGAWLMGTIEPAVETPAEGSAPAYRMRANAPQQSALQTPSAVLR